MGLHDLNRAQDTASSVNKLADIVQRDWPTTPSPITSTMLAKGYAPVYTWNGGVYGDDQILAKTNVLVDDRGIGDYEPRNQDDKAKMPGASPPNAIAGEPDFVISTVVNRPRGAIDPNEPYPTAASPAEPAPTITSLSPNTAVAGAPSPLAVTVTGTNFTIWTVLIVGNIQTPYFQYFSPTKIVLLMDPARSVAGVITVVASDHSVQSAASNFTYT
jgi:hypothetical protein